MRYEFGGLIFGGAYTWRGLFSEFYGSLRECGCGKKEKTLKCVILMIVLQCERRSELKRDFDNNTKKQRELIQVMLILYLSFFFVPGNLHWLVVICAKRRGTFLAVCSCFD